MPDEEANRVLVGAVLVSETMVDLRVLRMILEKLSQ